MDHVANPTSVICPGNGEPDDVRQMLTPTIGAISMGKRQYALRKKPLFLEVASMDGAVIFDERKILAIGAMIKPHSSASADIGARSAAARSAYLWGNGAVSPIKISSDGDISVLFKSDMGTDEELRFM